MARSVPHTVMNFYSDGLNPDCRVDCRRLLKRYATTIRHQYTHRVLDDPTHMVAFHCIDTAEFCIDNCPFIQVYTVSGSVYYVLLVCTAPTFRGLGYAARLLDGFLERVQSESPGALVVLSALESSVLFYESYGFRWTRQCLRDHPVLLQYERYEAGKEYYIMELFI